MLDRYYQTAKTFNVDIIVSVTADDPFKDPVVIDHAISIFKESQPPVDYASNCSYDGSITATFPEGLDIEVFSFSCLQRISKEPDKSPDREHVTPYIFKNSDSFSINGFFRKNPT